MARTNTLANFLTDVANAIRTKKGTQETISASTFDTEILNLPSGTYQTKTLTISANGSQTITPDQGYDAIDEITITTQVPQKQLQTKSYEFTTNQTIELTPDTGYDGFDIVTLTINVPQSGGGDVKLFETEQAMQADPNPSEGDLAVVYREEIQPVTEESEFDSCTFPQTVVLKEAFTGNVYGRFRAVDSSSGYFNGNVDMSSSNFRFDGFGNTRVRVQYTSSDGITYTRTDGGEELQEFGTVIKYEPMGPWNNVIGNFMKIGESLLEGIYKYRTNLTDMSSFHFPKLSSLTFNDSNTPSISEWYDNYYTVDSLEFLCNKIIKELSLTAYTPWFYLNNNQELCFITGSTTGPYIAGPLYDENKNFLGIGSNDMSYQGTMSTYRIADIATGTYEKLKDYTGIAYYQDDYYIPLTDISTMCCTSNSNKFRYCGTVLKNNSSSSWGELTLDWYRKYNSYEIAPTQLTATPGDVYKQLFYGKNGVESGTLGIPDNSFADVNAEIYNAIQNQYENMEPRILTDDDKTIAKNIYFIPVKKDGTPLLDTSNVTDMTWMFAGCSNLTTIPQLDTSKVTSIFDMFGGCSSLSDDSLNIIMQMYINATSYTGTKTLKYIGLTSEQADKCKTLSNYSAFTSAGWTTGY